VREKIVTLAKDDKSTKKIKAKELEND